MFKNGDLVESSSSDEEATPTPNKRQLMNTMLVLPGPSFSRYPIWYWRPVDQGQDVQKDGMIPSTSGLKRAHPADPAENSADLRKKFVDKQTENSSMDTEMKNNSQDVEDTQSTSEKEETDSSDDDENLVNSTSTEYSSNSEHEFSLSSDFHDQDTIIYGTEETNKEIVETTILTSSDDEI